MPHDKKDTDFFTRRRILQLGLGLPLLGAGLTWSPNLWAADVTHGFLNGNNPLFSYLKLKPGAGGSEDGMLEAREIIDLDLHAELAVLSACETARGEFRSGEGVVGIGWAIMMAGTRSVVATAWRMGW